MKDAPVKKFIDVCSDATLLGIGPMSEAVIKASLEICRDNRCPVFFIASRNQVDSDRLGGGYVMNWNQKKFFEAIKRIAGEVGFDGYLYICRDHGGPWQRDNEYREKLPEDKAMESAKESYCDDIKYGFNLLHIDPTKDPRQKSIPAETIIKRSIELVEFCEIKKREFGIKHIDYEVGTEEIGGSSSVEGFDKFIINFLKGLSSRNLPAPSFIVGKTGTLTKMNGNVGVFDGETARKLAAIAKEHGIGFKEHNSDYLSDEILRLHPKLGITMSNVAPEFAYYETVAYLDLAEKERENQDKLKNISNFVSVMQASVLKSGRWKKWLLKEESDLTEERIKTSPDKLKAVTAVCGHYVYNNNEVRKEKEKMIANLERLKVIGSAERFVVDRIKKSIEKYIINLNLRNISDKI